MSASAGRASMVGVGLGAGVGALTGCFGRAERQRQFLGDLRVLERGGLVERLALDPFRHERGRRDGRAAAVGLEARVLDDAESVLDAVTRYAGRYRQPRVNPTRVVIEIAVTRILGNL